MLLGGVVLAATSEICPRSGGSLLLLGDVSQVKERTCEGSHSYSSQKFPGSQKATVERAITTPGRGFRGRSQNYSSEKHPWSQKGRLWRDPNYSSEMFPRSHKGHVKGSLTERRLQESNTTPRKSFRRHRMDDSVERSITTPGEVSEKTCFGSLHSRPFCDIGHFSQELCWAPPQPSFPTLLPGDVPRSDCGKFSDVTEWATVEGSITTLGRSVRENYSSEKHPWSQKGRLWGSPALLLAEVSDVTEQSTVAGSKQLLGDTTHSSEKFPRSQKGRVWRNPTLLRGKGPTSQNRRLWRDPSLLLGEVSEKNCFGSLHSLSFCESGNFSQELFWIPPLSFALPRVVSGFSTVVLSLTSETSPPPHSSVL